MRFTVNIILFYFLTKVTLESYRIPVFQVGFVIDGFKNTGIIVITGVIYSMLLTVTAAYALSKKYLPGRNIFINFIIFTMFFSGGLIPYYMLMRNLHLIDNLAALVLPFGVNTFYLIIIKTFFQNIPPSITESAQIDGANEIFILFKIVLPVSMPIIATFILFYSVDRWNEWFYALLLMKSVEKMPLQVILKSLLTNFDMIKGATAQANWDSFNKNLIYDEGVKMACVTIVTLPVLMFYPFAQKYFIKGIMIGAVKS